MIEQSGAYADTSRSGHANRACWSIAAGW